MIQNKKQLTSEIRKLQLKSKFQEDAIHKDIDGFKRKLSISGFVMSIVTGIVAAGIGSKVMAGQQSGTIFNSSVATGISLLLKKYFLIAEQKVEEFAVQLINKLLEITKDEGINTKYNADSDLNEKMDGYKNQQDSKKPET